MEYRTTHGKVLAKLEKKKHEKERRKTKGKFIVSKFYHNAFCNTSSLAAVMTTAQVMCTTFLVITSIIIIIGFV